MYNKGKQAAINGEWRTAPAGTPLKDLKEWYAGYDSIGFNAEAAYIDNMVGRMNDVM